MWISGNCCVAFRLEDRDVRDVDLVGRCEERDIRMTNPPHRQVHFREGCLVGRVGGLSVAAAARDLNVGRRSLAMVLSALRRISPKMALKLEAFGWANVHF